MVVVGSGFGVVVGSGAGVVGAHSIKLGRFGPPVIVHSLSSECSSRQS